jgi:hypothetical protein
MISDGVLERLTVQINGDLDGLESAVRNASNAFDNLDTDKLSRKVAGLAESLETKLERATRQASEATDVLDAAFRRGLINADQYNQGLARLKDKMDGVGNEAEKTGGKLSTLVTGAIGGFVAGFAMEGVQALGDFAQKTLETADDIGDLAQRLGVTTTAVQELQGVFVAAGGSPELMTNALDQLNQRLGEFTMSGKGPAADAFKQLGIDSQITSGQIKGTEETFYAITKAIENVKDPAERARLSMELFGKSAGKDMVEVLGAGSAAMQQQRARMQELGLVMDEDLIKKTAEAKLSIDKASFAMAQWATIGMATVITGLEKIFNVLSNSTSAFFKIGGQMIDGLVGGINAGIQRAVQAARNLGAAVSKAFSQSKDIEVRSPSRVFRYFGEMIGEGLVLGINSKQSAVAGAVEQIAQIAATAFPKVFGAGTKGGGILGAISAIASVFSGGKTPSFKTPSLGGGGGAQTMTLNNYLGNELLDSRTLKLSSGAAVQSFQASRAQVPVDMGRANRNRIW